MNLDKEQAKLVTQEISLAEAETIKSESQNQFRVLSDHEIMYVTGGKFSAIYK